MLVQHTLSRDLASRMRAYDEQLTNIQKYTDIRHRQFSLR